MLMAQAELGGIFNRDDPLARRNEIGQHIEQRGLARASAARDHDVAPPLDADPQEIKHLDRGRARIDQVLRTLQAAGKSPDGQRRPAQRQGRNDRVDPRTIGQARIDHRRGLIDATAKGCDDALDHTANCSVVCEGTGMALQAATALDPDLIRRIDHDLADRTVFEQTLERPQANRLIQHIDDQLLAIDGLGQADRLIEQLIDHAANFNAQRVGVGQTQVATTQIEGLQDLTMHQTAPAQGVLRQGRRRVISRRVRCVGRELHTQAMTADLDQIEWGERAEIGDALAIDQRAAERAGVGNAHHAALGAHLDLQLRMHPADPPSCEHQLAIAAAADATRQPLDAVNQRGLIGLFDRDQKHCLDSFSVDHPQPLTACAIAGGRAAVFTGGVEGCRRRCRRRCGGGLRPWRVFPGQGHRPGQHLGQQTHWLGHLRGSNRRTLWRHRATGHEARRDEDHQVGLSIAKLARAKERPQHRQFGGTGHTIHIACAFFGKQPRDDQSFVLAQIDVGFGTSLCEPWNLLDRDLEIDR